MTDKQEPQAQAEPVVFAVFRTDDDCGHVDLIPFDRPLAVYDGMELITLQSHREAMAVVQSACLESVTAVRLAFEQTIAKKDAALDACVDALEGAKGNINPERGFADEVELEIDAAISKLNEARK